MIGLVLEGGGAKGAYHIGVYRALIESGISIDGVTGSSIGAINGAIIAQGDGVLAWDIWSGMTNQAVFDIDEQFERELRTTGLSVSTISNGISIIKKMVHDGGIDTGKIKAFIDRHIDEKRLRESSVDFGLVTYSITSSTPMELMLEDIPHGKLTDYILASASFPGFKLETIDGERLVDGGVWDNLPVSMLQDRGYDTIIAVRTNAVGRVKKTSQFGTVRIDICPSEDLGLLLDFDPQRETRNLNLGYLDTLRLYRGLLGTRYYIEPPAKSDWAFNMLASLESEKILQVGKMLGIHHLPARRMLFEQIVPKISAILGIDNTIDYNDLVIMAYEIVAEKLSIDRLRIYTIEELLQQAKNAYLSREQKMPRFLSTLARGDARLARLVKEDVLDLLLSIFL